ncbi:ABC transporter permease [Rubellimicrobium aerolatum]|uniref:ABC transporter permease n=1 Tax=Rubellimicrobium aerolatum TaxID=490979 RepID=A0ABW0SHM6_9RHOB|nr:ABC transporter permease subunit [Rubellimicrobium aerolatum]MBP1807509.1 putative spermidine/putrescine transport system permease protein/spermidine/putrescine transport system permease protein [Rubellimicrobium aerolatum]
MTDAALSQGPTSRGGPSYWPIWRAIGKWAGLFMLGLIYFPLVWLMLLSFSANPLSGIPGSFTSTHFRALFASTDWHQPLLASVVIGLIVGLVCAVVATVVGRAVPSLARPGRTLLLFVLPLFVPGMSMGAALFIFARSVLDLKLGFWSIALGHFVWAFPFALLIILVVTTRFDHRLVEAGRDLGASGWRVFWDIEFPILMPGIVSAALFGFLMSFNEVMRTIFLRGTAETMPVWNWVQAAAQQSQVPIIFALSTIVLAVTLPLLCGVFWLLFAKLDKS